MSHYAQPGSNLFGQAVERRRRQSSAPFSEDGGEEEEESMSGSADLPEYSDEDDSDAGTIYSTRESARRTPAQIQKEEMVKKQALLRELIQMKRDGIQLSRDYTDADPVELMSYEIERHKQTENENTMVGIYKVCINMGCHGIQMLNTVKGPWVPMEGWAEAVTTDMNVYDRPLRRIHRQYFAKGPAGNPWLELGFALVGSLIFHIMVAKMMGTKNGAAMFAKMFNGGEGGGMMSALGIPGGVVGPGAGAPQPVPNAGNPFPNHNVPPPRQQAAPPPRQQAAPPPRQQAAPPPRPQTSGSRSGRRPMRRPASLRPAHPPPRAPPRQPSVDEMDSESTLNLGDDDE